MEELVVFERSLRRPDALNGELADLMSDYETNAEVRSQLLQAAPVLAGMTTSERQEVLIVAAAQDEEGVDPVTAIVVFYGVKLTYKVASDLWKIARRRLEDRWGDDLLEGERKPSKGKKQKQVPSKRTKKKG